MLTSQHQSHLATWPWRHVNSELPADRCTRWLLPAAAAALPLPLALAADIGSLLCSPPAAYTIQPPPFLSPDVNTTPYLAFLSRLANHPLIRSLLPHNPSDAVIGLLLARLVAGVGFPDAFLFPAGSAGVLASRRLAQSLADPALLWLNTPPHLRLDWPALLSPPTLSRIEANLAALRHDDLRFLLLYGPPHLGAPDPRDLLDLFSLIGLPDYLHRVLSHTLRLLPRLAAARLTGGADTYPEGGYEGLARHGSLDSLLPSELAYDESLFFHRLLNREALYYGREAVPEQRRELAYLVAQAGFGLGADATLLGKALLLALAHILQRRGYEVVYSFAAAELTPPRSLDRPGDVARVLYYQAHGRPRPAAVLPGVLAQLRRWRERYRRRHLFWLLAPDFDRTQLADHAALYAALRAEAVPQAWYLHTGHHPAPGNGKPRKPPSAREFGYWQVVDTELLWQGQPPPYLPDLPPPPPVSGWRQQQTIIEGYAFRDGVRDVLHFTHDEQWAAWQTLAKLEDSPEVDGYLRQLAPPEMVYIPPGTFLMGSGDNDPLARDNEKPQHELWLGGYYMDKYPVTNAHFHRFIEAGGYANRAWWTEAGWERKERENWRQPRYWDDSHFNGERQPVVGVSWYEAAAYACWAGKALPSEAHWEKAASWDPERKQKRIYPWGDDWQENCCNTQEANHGVTVAVDTYSPHGDSYYGVADMGGNVNEWCSTRWDDKNDSVYPYPYQTDDGREEIDHEGNLFRVLRGGSWNDRGQAQWARCGFRFRFFPWHVDYNWGFRCLVPTHAFLAF